MSAVQQAIDAMENAYRHFQNILDYGIAQGSDRDKVMAEQEILRAAISALKTRSAPMTEHDAKEVSPFDVMKRMGKDDGDIMLFSNLVNLKTVKGGGHLTFGVPKQAINKFLPDPDRYMMFVMAMDRNQYRDVMERLTRDVVPENKMEDSPWTSDCCGMEASGEELDLGICRSCRDHASFSRHDANGNVIETHE